MLFPFGEAVAVSGLASSSSHVDEVLLRMQLLHRLRSGAHDSVPRLLARPQLCLVIGFYILMFMMQAI